MVKYQSHAEFQKEMCKFFHEYRDKLGINPAWKITIEIKQIKATYAEVQWDYPTRRFWVYINDKKNRNSKELKDSIIHELIHILLTPYTDKAEEISGKLIDGKTSKATLKKLNLKEESIVKKLTSVIMELEKNVE
jgi:hypothetical protein